jgi:hypothetical protein
MLARSLSKVRAGARPLSTAVLPDKPPIALFGIAGRYASAIYSAAAKKGELAQVDQDLKVGPAAGSPLSSPTQCCASLSAPGPAATRPLVRTGCGARSQGAMLCAVAAGRSLDVASIALGGQAASPCWRAI